MACDNVRVNKEFEKAYEALNKQQREAVEAIDGPVLVIAGPGTGKTQLIGTRVGFILKNADVEPSNILLLTYTENGVQEMRERLEKLIPQQAHKIYISTYHGFGNDIIQANPEYFENLEGDAIDELARHSILRSIIDELPYSDPLKPGEYYLGDIINFISDAKRALLAPSDIAATAKANWKFISTANTTLRPQLDQLARVSKKTVLVFEQMLAKSEEISAKGSAQLPGAIRPMGEYLKDSLGEALRTYGETGKTTSLTAWKKRWLANDRQANQVIDGAKAAQRLAAAAGIYQSYQDALTTSRLYDYDDMILRVIEALQKYPEFKYTLAERWQYIMLDEFQDTNPAQLRLIELLTDHPVHESRPNVLAVGDDDQAIFAFQGADHANMARFVQIYRDVKRIPLKDNYRSHKELVELGHNLAKQISSRLHNQFPEIEKKLVAANSRLPRPPVIEAREFKTDASEYEWLASEIKQLSKAGIELADIAVISPKHKYLKAIMPYLQQHGIAVSYEKRQNIWDNQGVFMLSQMARLVLALAQRNYKLSDALWAQVISYDFWDLPTELIWQISWAAKKGERSGKENWTSLLLKNKSTANIALFFQKLADLANLATLEEMMDALIGLGNMHETLKLPMKSPYFDYNFGGKRVQAEPSGFVELLSDLSLLRSLIRERQRRQSTATRLSALIDYADECQAAGVNILNTSPYYENKKAVNLLTAYGAKGREFAAVFVIAAQSEVWGSASRSKSSAIKLPANLEYISYVGMSDDERLRLFYVAVTRAQTNLYLSSHKQTMAGKHQKHLEFLAISEDGQGRYFSATLPAGFSQIIQDEADQLGASAAENYWGGRHLPPLESTLLDLLQPRLQTFRLSATAINHFTDVESYGPNYFFIHDLLQFPQAPSPRSAFGTAAHDSLRFVGSQLVKTGKLPSYSKVLSYFKHQLSGGWLNDSEKQKLQARGEAALKVWFDQIAKTLKGSDRYEQSFFKEGVVVDDVRLSGKIDRLAIDRKRRRISVIDVKTGKAFRSWSSSVKSHKFKQQLMFYKLLVEGSSSYKGFVVDKAAIEFFEPDDDGIVSLPYEYNERELADFKRLIKAVWDNIQYLDLPDISKYPPKLTGIMQFEKDLTN